ncbi:MAG: hypothetical protein KatS3mg046_104 [Bellilinea sp.]|nr:MAG: hypothetical protein KatS3mg046_104 [Bellilinea sp.]
MLRILDNGIESRNGALHAAWCLVEEDGRRYYRVAVLRELKAITDDPQNKRQAGEGILGKQWAAITGLYNAGVNFVYSALGIFQPEHVGIVQLYGAAVSADSVAAGISRAERDAAAVEATLAGFSQSQLRPPELDIIRWYVEFLSSASKPLALLGHPDPRVKRRGTGRDGALPEEADDLAIEQNEILFRGLAKLRENFVFQVVSDHVPRQELVRDLEQMARIASNYASRRKGSKSIGFSVGIPIFNALAHGYSGAGGRADSHARSQAESWNQNWGEADTESKSHSVSRGSSVSLGESESESGSRSVMQGTSQMQSQSTMRSESTMESHSRMQSTTESSSWGTSSGSSSGGSESASWSLGHGASHSQSVNVGGGANIGVAKFDIGGSQGVTESWNLTQGESVSSNWGTFQSSSEMHGVANTTGEGWTTSRGQTTGTGQTVGSGTSEGVAESSGWSKSTSRVVTSMYSETDTTGEAHTTSRGYGRGYGESDAIGQTRSTVGAQTAGAGLTYGLAPAINVNRTWQVEDDVAERLTEILRGFEGLLNTATHSGGFVTSAYLLTDSERAAVAAASLVPEAFYGEGAPTPVLTAEPPEAEREAVMEAARAFVPFKARTNDPNDPFDGWLFWRYASLLPADKVAAYVAPSLLQEGTLKVIAPIPDGMGFYPRMSGEVVLGHQYSPNTADLTNAAVRLDKSRLMHTMFAGDTGWGKSVAAVRMAYEAAKQWNMRVVVLDFGFAWRSLLNAPGLDGRVDIRQLRPDGVRPLRWNPLQIGTYINPETQLKAFADIFGSVAQLGQKQQQHRLLDALRRLYVSHGVMVDDPQVRADPQWGRVQADEAARLGLTADTPLGNLSADERQRLAVERSKAVGLGDLYAEIESEYDLLNPRDQVGRGVLEGILWRLKSLVRGAPAAQFQPGADTVPVEDLGRPNGVVVLEGGKFLDNFAKAWLLGWAGWLIYSDMVARRERQINRGEADLFMVFEEANIIFTGLEGGDSSEGRSAPTVGEQYSNMFRDSRKYGAFFGVVTQSPSLIPQGIISSCNNLVVGFLKNPKDKDIVLSALARSEKGFVDEPWRRFLADEHIGMVIGRFPYAHSRELQLPILFRPLILDVPEPTDEEIAQKLGRITL